ncbi:MAG TPA: hypothetical protein VN253_16785, partial [Kofleriaceae bacterium]|nr:hypothetical protein [Kofleriaceae bacterium]
DLDALAARHAALEAEVARKQRELDEVTALLAEARRVDQAEAHFARAPALRRRQWRHLIAGALVAGLASGAALGAMSGPLAEASTPGRAAAARDAASFIAVHTWTAAQRADRRKAVQEALQQLRSAKDDAAARKRAKTAGRPFDPYLYREELASLAREHER